jgi:hypothetical protein
VAARRMWYDTVGHGQGGHPVVQLNVLGGQPSARQAQAVIDYHLDRVFSASRP